MTTIDWLTDVPIAHRGLHDISRRIPENSLAAARAAISHGYSIEVDLHPTRDGVPVVFHDLNTDRMTGQSGRIRDLSAAHLGELRLAGSDERVATLEQLLALVDGKAGIVLEMKGLAAQEDRHFAQAVASVLRSYPGRVAVMSFNHWLLRDFKALGCNVPLGLTAEGDDHLCGVHEAIDAEIGFDFLSYGIGHLPCRFASQFRASGRPVITWTVRSEEQARRSAEHADQITFEGFLPPAGHFDGHPACHDPIGQ